LRIDGLLTITLDKREEVKPRKIQISAGDGKKHPQMVDTTSTEKKS
jgi:hypothetical protein